MPTTNTKPIPLNPPATEGELNRASEIWTAAQDDMVSRGFARHLWGCQHAAGQEFMVLSLRLTESRFQPATEAIEHVLSRIHESPEVGYYMGYGTESFERLCSAYAQIHGETVEAAERQFHPTNPRNPTDAMRKQVEELEDRLSGTHTSCCDDDAPEYGPEHLTAEDMVERVKLLLGMHSADPVRCVREIAALYDSVDLPINLVAIPA